MRISDWSSDVCSSDLCPSEAGKRRCPAFRMPAGRNARIGIPEALRIGRQLHPVDVDRQRSMLSQRVLENHHLLEIAIVWIATDEHTYRVSFFTDRHARIVVPRREFLEWLA